MEGSKAGRVKGLAPFASVEDLSDEQESPPEPKTRLTLPGIREDAVAPSTTAPNPGHRGAAPRIDISRASSSSHHEDSSPEREIFAGSAEGSSGVKLGFGFSEEMALDLRSSTEELDFHDPAALEGETKQRRKKLHQQHAVTKYELEAQSEKEQKERKDSGCSDIVLLSISGRTSRLSSIGSAASGGSGASHLSYTSHLSGVSHMSGASALSGTSHLSAVSHLSKVSRCSSPHRMLLETSFCGPKPIPTVSLEAEYPPKESVEACLLARKTDPKGAVLPAEGITTPQKTTSSPKSSLDVAPSGSRTSGKVSSRHKEKSESSRSKIASSSRKNSNRMIALNSDLQVIIPLHGDPEPIPILSNTVPQPLSPQNGIYIPLKGPDVTYCKTSSSQANKPGRSSPYPEDTDLVRFIPLHGYDETHSAGETVPDNITSWDQEPYSHRLVHKRAQSNNVDFKSWTEDSRKSEQRSIGKSHSPELETTKSKPSTLEFSHGDQSSRPVQSLTQLMRDQSRTPSPAASLTRNSIFRRSSEASSIRKSSSGSAEAKTKKDSRNKSVFTSLFKKGKERDSIRRKSEYSEKNAVIDPKITNVEFKFNQEARPQSNTGDSVLIPLHSPDSIVEPLIVSEQEGNVHVHHEQSPPENTLQTILHSNSQQTIPLLEMSPKKSKFFSESQLVEDVIVIENTNTYIPEEANNKGIKEWNLVTREDKKVERKDETADQKPVEIGTIQNKYQCSASNESELDASIKKEIELLYESAVKVSKDVLLGDKIVKSANSEERRSSESEADSDAVAVPDEDIRNSEHEDREEDERKGLVHQHESLEEELPYVPTTLPQERSVAVPIIPIRQRVSEVKTFPIDRPRSTTPINLSTLDDYVTTTHDESSTSSSSDKLQIILPRTSSVDRGGHKLKSPRRGKTWSHFTEQALGSPRESRHPGSPSPPAATPPPLPPRATPSPAPWISFEELPERRRAPKRITTLPSSTVQHSLVYSYVNPDECSCECHENQSKLCAGTSKQCSNPEYNKDKHKQYRT